MNSSQAQTKTPHAGSAKTQSALPFLQMLMGSGRFKEAFLAAASIAEQESNPVILNIAAIAAREANDPASADRYWSRCIERFPQDGNAYINRGNLLAESGYAEQAEHLYLKAIELDPDAPDARYNLGNLYSRSRQYQAALGQYREALKHAEGRPDLHNSMGCACSELGLTDEALHHLQRAVQLAPRYAEAWLNLGLLYRDTRQLKAAAGALQHAALPGDPSEAQALSEWAMVQMSLCDWAAAARTEARLLGLLRAGRAAGVVPFVTLALPNCTASDQRAAAAQATRQAPPPVDTMTDDPAERSPGRIRVGYLSADLHAHATAYLLAGVLEHRDTARFETFLYSYGPQTHDDMQNRLRAACEHFVDIAPLSDGQAAERIAADRLDLLIDLKGFTKHARLDIGAMRPAPILVNWLGYPGTLGNRRLADYLIGDPVVTPVSQQAQFEETLALMPHCYQPTDSRREILPPPDRAEVGLPADGLVFCCFNQAYKITEARAQTWFAILGRTPGAVLWLLEPDASARAALLEKAGRHGIASERLVFAPQVAQRAHIARLQLADLALDTFPYTSHTTASDLLWAGVPLLTRAGDTMASRVAASILQAAGLHNLVVTTEDDYVNAAVRLAGDAQALASVRLRAQAARNTALFDTETFARNLETLFSRIVERGAHGTPEPIVL
ncbi:tetratricopeptide repeat protein [Ralstonia solanacearum]|uniref:protein O-GlcNAc transferase n=1 Tax=Ralstonia solanacearum TaxID=305 RepID=A0AAE3NFZ6_RALSL|nr:tetratricopeptide repeat protein [Ralstonia solanacearum]MBB6584817.1 tetratricopeptide repeat protein [Ralstonia solanacearum]MDB0520833.1 tetratricopeptide repeat protein [Ralstonia solanacearum]